MFFDKNFFREKYRSASIRLPYWDYRRKGYYFVTICTEDRECFFGEIRNGIMGLNKTGCAASQFWQEIPNHFDNARLDEWVVMPNHIHGILDLHKSAPRRWDAIGGGGRDAIGGGGRDAINRVPTAGAGDGGATHIHNPMGKKSLGEIIRWFKGRASFEIRKFNPHFAWQTRFYERIIRDENELNRIKDYIKDNPKKWEEDRNNGDQFLGELI